MTRGLVKAMTKGQEKATINIEPPGASCRQTPQFGEAAIRKVRGLSFVYRMDTPIRIFVGIRPVR